MKRKLLIIISALVVSACVEEVNLDKAFEKTVTVNCILNADAETQSVDIKYNGDFGEILFERVPDADVVMFADGKELGHLKKIAFSRWVIDLKPEPGVTYRLEIQVPGEKKITAETTVPEPAPIRMASNPEDIDKYLQTFIHEAGTSSACWISIDKSRLIGSDHPYRDEFNKLEKIHGSLYPEGYKSRFTVCDDYVRISPVTLEKNLTFLLEGSSIYRGAEIVFITMSDDYDLYRKSAYQKIKAYTGEDFTDFLEENVVYSNIKNGTGIFGAYVTRRITI